MIRHANAYASMKKAYLKHNCFKIILETNIAILERKLEKLVPRPGEMIGFVKTEIHLPGREQEALRLYFFIHPETGDIAPFWLQLTRDPQRKRLGKAGADMALRSVLEELGW